MVVSNLITFPPDRRINTWWGFIFSAGLFSSTPNMPSLKNTFVTWLCCHLRLPKVKLWIYRHCLSCWLVPGSFVSVYIVGVDRQTFQFITFERGRDDSRTCWKVVVRKHRKVWATSEDIWSIYLRPVKM